MVGSIDPAAPRDEQDGEAAMALVNRCLTEAPRGRIVAIERGVATATIGEHQVVLQNVTHHLGFPRRPAWLDA